MLLALVKTGYENWQYPRDGLTTGKKPLKINRAPGLVPAIE